MHRTSEHLIFYIFIDFFSIVHTTNWSVILFQVICNKFYVHVLYFLNFLLICFARCSVHKWIPLNHGLKVKTFSKDSKKIICYMVQSYNVIELILLLSTFTIVQT